MENWRRKAEEEKEKIEKQFGLILEWTDEGKLIRNPAGETVFCRDCSVHNLLNSDILDINVKGTMKQYVEDNDRELTFEANINGKEIYLPLLYMESNGTMWIGSERWD